MPKIKWDQSGERLFETGVDQGVVYPMAVDGTYPNGYGWNGLISVSESPEGGEPTALWADNIKYLEMMSTEEWKGSMEAYMYPKEFEPCDGMVSPEAGVSLGQQARQKFGLCYRTRVGNDAQGDSYGYKLHLVYGLQASPSEKSYETVNDSPDAITFSWDISSTPVRMENYRAVSTITIDSTVADPDALAALEALLYGTDGTGGSEGTTPQLPLPEDVLDLFD